MFKNTISMQYPNYNGHDGLVHEITPLGLYQIRIPGKNNIYLLSYNDESLGKNDMNTILFRTKDGFVKMPLKNYALLGTLLPFAKEVDTSILGSKIELGTPTSIGEILAPAKQRKRVKISVFRDEDGNTYVDKYAANKIFGINSNEAIVQVDPREIEQVATLQQDENLIFVFKEEKDLVQKPKTATQSLFEVFIRNNGMYVTPTVAREVFGKSAGLQDVRVTQEEIDEVEEMTRYTSHSLKAKYVNQRVRVKTKTEMPPKRPIAAEQIQFEVFIRNNGMFVTPSVAREVFGKGAGLQDVRVTQEEINDVEESTRYSNPSFKAKYVDQRTLVKTKTEQRSKMKMAEQALFEVFIREDGLYVNKYAAELFGIFNAQGDVKVTQREIDEVERKTEHSDTSYKAKYINQRQLQIAIFEVHEREDGSMYVDDYVAGIVFGVNTHGANLDVTQSQIDSIQNTVFPGDIKYQASYKKDPKKLSATSVVSPIKANPLPSASAKPKAKLRIYNFANGLYVERAQARLAGLRPNDKQEYYYITRRDLNSLKIKFDLEVEVVRTLQKDELYREKGTNKLLLALETIEGTFLTADGFAGLDDDTYNRSHLCTSDRINRIMLNTNGVPYTLYDQERLLPEIASSIREMTSNVNNQSLVPNMIFSVLNTLKENYSKIKTSDRTDVKSYYNVVLAGLQQAIINANNNKAQRVQAAKKVTPVPGQGRRV